MAKEKILKRVAIVGGGAAGMSCAAALAQHPDRFEVTVFEKDRTVGGQATSIPLEKARYGAEWMNNGVQGGSSIFKHTFKFFRMYGHDPKEVQLQVSFGKGRESFWTNCFPSHLISEFESEIRKFGWFLKLVKWTLPISGLVPINIMLRLLLFKKGFGDKMVYPLIALFLGTGNQTAHVPCGIVERLFDDPNMRLWEYDPSTLLPNQPTMFTFDHLHAFYVDWKADLSAKGVQFRLETEVTQVISRHKKDGVCIEIVAGPDRHLVAENFDELCLCVLADDALRILSKTASWTEKAILGSAAFYDDVTVTHSDRNYFDSQYETEFKLELCANTTSKTQEASASSSSSPGQSIASPSFHPMYFTKSYESDPRLLEMSFNCSNYQHQLIEAKSGRNEEDVEPVYQTIFLDKGKKDLWTKDQIDKEKIIATNWWHQLGHRWQHYLCVVPWMWLIQGNRHTCFAGSWTVVNMHEVAIVSGLNAAYRMGADYTQFDRFATDFFTKCLLLSHGIVFSLEERRRGHQNARK